ncbi:hypothetical protein D3C76_1605510 [compost metagenome]
MYNLTPDALLSEILLLNVATRLLVTELFVLRSAGDKELIANVVDVVVPVVNVQFAAGVGLLSLSTNTPAGTSTVYVVFMLSPVAG